MVKMGERTSSFWPLPGGYRNYLETLRNLLGRIAEEPAFDDLVEWASKILDTESGWLRNSIRIVIIYSGLTGLRGDRICLTDKGLEFLRTGNPGTVIRAFLERIWGIREIIMWLGQEGPLSRRQIFEKCLSLGVGWRHDSQVGYRLMWLQALGCIEGRRGKYALTSTGVEIARELLSSGLQPEPPGRATLVAGGVPEPAIVRPLEAPSHSELQNMLVGLGELEGYRAEKEFRINRERLDVVWFKGIREMSDLAFEIQKGGNLYSALVKLKEAWNRWGCLSVLVTTQEYLEDAERWLGSAFHEMERDARIALWSEIAEWYEAARKRKEVKERLEIDP